ncbi:LLM class flavin-dependent oxidoreductase [Ectobacillus funiculus]|uniref:LLM class flavin-dependent oxidoreductase n=1 Tax=Ectobacillus funiculus TaxID=137993 RepID=UPI00101C921C|nr:LLM class flavin-dependent oxidoreductase [Ectobacillus funiculus]
MVEFITVLPTHGDSQSIFSNTAHSNRVDPWKTISDREPSLEYLKTVIQQAEKKGFDTVLLPTGNTCIDSIVTASALITATEKIKFLFAARPGFISPTTFARQFASLDYYSNKRALVNIVTGGSPQELNADGDFLDHSTRYKRTQEFIHVLKRLFTEDNFDHHGDFYTLKNASLFYKPLQQPHPKIFFGGSSAAAKKTAAKEADVYMLWGETLELTQQQLEEIKVLAVQEKRHLDYSVSLQVILGDTEEEAWAKADKLLKSVSQNHFAYKEKQTKSGESEGNKRLQKLVSASRDNGFRIGPNLWAGVASVVGGNGISLVGTPDQVADRIIEYIDLGFSKILLRGYPFLETIQEVGDYVIPRVHQKLSARQYSR